jgi:hypothetical protein
VPSSDEKLVVAAEATSSQVEATIVNPFEGLGEDNDDIDRYWGGQYYDPSYKAKPCGLRKVKIKGGHIEVLTRFDYIDNVEWVQLEAMT